MKNDSYFTFNPHEFCQCGRQKKPQFPTCWNCKEEVDKADLLQEVAQAAYYRGWNNGFDMALKKSPQLSQEMVKKLISLCHPDKHGGSAVANEVTVWLLQQRK